MSQEGRHATKGRATVAHAVWAAIGVAVCLLLILTGRKGHPPAVIFLPLVLVAWAMGHGLIWGALRLAAAGRRKTASAADGQSWPRGLRVAAFGTAAGALLLRRRWSRPLSATLAFGWAALLGVQVVQHFRNGSSDSTGLLVVVALMASLLLLGFHLVSSSKAKSFLGD